MTRRVPRPSSSRVARAARLAALAALASIWASSIAACGGATPEPVDPATGKAIEAKAKPAPPPPKRDAAGLAIAAVTAKVTALVHVDRVREHPAGPRIAAMPAVAGLFEGSGIDPLRDVDRVFVAGPELKSSESVVAAEHHLTAEQLEQVWKGLLDRSDPPGAKRDDLQSPAVTVTLKGHERTIAAATPTLLVALPKGAEAALAGFAKSAGLPLPVGAEMLSASALEPAKTLDVRGGPKFPESLASASATVTPGPAGGLRLEIDAASTSENQAASDAADLTRMIDEKTSFKVSILRVRVLPRIVFKPEGAKVRADVKLAASDVAQILSLATMAM